MVTLVNPEPSQALQKQINNTMVELQQKHQGEFTSEGNGSAKCMVCDKSNQDVEVEDLKVFGDSGYDYPEVSLAILRCRFGNMKEHDGGALLTGVVLLKGDLQQDRSLVDHCEGKRRDEPSAVTQAEQGLFGEYSGASTRLADATKWLFGAAGGIAVVLLAGVQFSGFGKASDEGRNLVIFLAGVALITVGCALVLASLVLVSRKTRLSELLSWSADAGEPVTEIAAVKELKSRGRRRRLYGGEKLEQTAERLFSLLAERNVWRRLSKAGDSRADDALDRVAIRISATVAQAEYLDVKFWFGLAQVALLSAAAAVFATAGVGMWVLAKISEGCFAGKSYEDYSKPEVIEKKNNPRAALYVAL